MIKPTCPVSGDPKPLILRLETGPILVSNELLEPNVEALPWHARNLYGFW